MTNDASVTLAFLSLFISGPIITFLHELGHAIPVLIFSKDGCTINLGKKRSTPFIFKMGKLKINIHNYYLCGGSIHWTSLPKNKIIWLTAYLGGPIVSLIISIITYNLWSRTNIMWLGYASEFSFIQFIVTILPIKYPFGFFKDMPSDGMRCLKLLTHK